VLSNNGRPTIGVLAGWQFYWTDTPLSYLSPIYRGIRQAAHELGCNLLLGCGMGSSASSGDPLRPVWPVPSPDTDFAPIGPWNTDGLVAVVPLHSAARSHYLQEARAAGHPVVFVGSGESGPAIKADNASGIEAAMRHLVAHGHRQIAFIAGSQEDVEGDSGARLRAYQAALATFDLPSVPQLIAYGRHVFAGGYAAMRQIIQSGAHFTAVLASNDESALGAMQALKDAGRQIPEDVAVIGFDDRPESAAHEPALSSIHFPLFLMGYRAVELLLKQIGNAEGEVEQVTIPTYLVPRESCGCGRLEVRIPDAARLAPSSHQQTIEEGVLAARMAETVLAETHQLGFAQLWDLCAGLVAAFVRSTRQPEQPAFQQALDALLRQSGLEHDEVYLWQTAISVLADSLPGLFADWGEQPIRARANALLDYARIATSNAIVRQHRRFVVEQRWTVDRIGRLTAHLLMALDEAQVYQVLAQHLPEMGVSTAWVVEFDASGADPRAWNTLHPIVPPGQGRVRFPTPSFPPAELIGGDQPWSVALAPLVGPRGQLGYVAFDTAQLDLYGAIVQQLAAALNTAQLYREATEGRRLAEEANQMKSRFLSTVSHELRTPLNLIVGLSSILLQDGDAGGAALPEATRQDVVRIHANAQHLGALIGDVLDLASSEAGQLRLTYEYVDLAQALRMVAETGRHLAQAKGLAWRMTIPASGPWVWGDRTRLRQVALNLISNAVKFTDQGEISLSLETGGACVTVAVRDTGIGIPTGEQQSIFDEFRRSERAVTRGYGGLGLGLAICRRLVELHGGTMEVASAGEEGAGSTISFTLPTVPAPTLQTPMQSPASPETQRVLVLAPGAAGDERLPAHLLQRGYAVDLLPLEARPGWLAHLLMAPAAAVVLDVTRPTSDGWVALQTIKGNPALCNLPVLLFAGSEETGALLEIGYLTKPIELAELNQALDQQWLPGDGAAAQRTFLVVDDDPNTLDLHARIVQAHAPTNRVLKAHNGQEALEILARASVDLVLLDLMMPGMDGFAVLDAMRSQASTREIPVIVVTGQVLTEAEMARLNQGVATVLGKGLYSLEETLAHLETALAHERKLSSEAQRLVRRAMAYLHEHYTESLTRRAIAEHVGLDEDYLTYCFRQELGMTPITYLNRYRVNQARHLLKQTDKSVTAIALEVGFSDSSYFSRIFKRETGMAPDAYRRT
jgi:signal transduction histidine kinase/DNA-binding LacI/PurR family transcriptional regulator/AraC-like DNA-binding protein